MVRKLDKIEKEMGYCEIKLEKERRLRRQAEFLRADLDVLERFDQLHGGHQRPLSDLPYSRMARQVVTERRSREEPGPGFDRFREEFVAVGVLEIVREEREIIHREVENIEGKLESFADFGRKRATLEEEKREAFSSIGPKDSSRMRKLDEEFKKTEHLWNSLTEDALNLDEAIFYLSRHVDYVKSARSFLVSAKGSFDIESWVDSEYRGNLFRHSNVGRAKEMIDGANRNLKLAQKELVCVTNLDFPIEGSEPLLVRFLGSLFDDIFIDGRIERTIGVAESAIQESEARLGDAQRKRERLHKKLERAEAQRVELFQKLGGETIGHVAVN